MPDAKVKRQPQDTARVTLGEQWEVRYWMETFGISNLELRGAVDIVGNGAHDVRQYLRRK